MPQSDCPATGPYVQDLAASPFPGFALAADAAVRHLGGQIPMDLWLVTEVDGDDQRIVAAHGTWAELAPPEAVFDFSASFCCQMLQGAAPSIAPDVAAEPAYAAVAIGPLARVRSYIGVPLLRGENELFGTLCAFAGTPRSRGLTSSLDLVQFVASLLSTVLTREAFALERSTEAANAYSLAEIDTLTPLRNRRGWQGALAAETARCHRLGSPASVLAVRLEASGVPGATTAERLARCAGVLRRNLRAYDVIARTDGADFAVLAVECGPGDAALLLERISPHLASADLRWAAAGATRLPGEELLETWHRARRSIAGTGALVTG